jgi:hypothetical protein
LQAACGFGGACEGPGVGSFGHKKRASVMHLGTEKKAQNPPDVAVTVP